MEAGNVDAAAIVLKFQLLDLAHLVAIAQLQMEGVMNFRAARAMVARRVNIGRPLRGAEVQEIMGRSAERLAKLREDSHQSGDAQKAQNINDLIQAERESIDRFLMDIGGWAIPHVCIWVPKADDFTLAVAHRMTGGIVDRELFIEEVKDREAMLERMGINVYCVDFDVSDMLNELKILQGRPDIVKDVAAAAEGLQFPRKRADIRRARQKSHDTGARFVEGP